MSIEQHSNQLLATLQPQDRDYLAKVMRVEHPARGQRLASRSEPPCDIWFPHNAMVSLATSDTDGRAVQAALVGSEGCIGVESILADVPPFADATIEIEGDLSVISARRFRAALETHPGIQDALVRYLYALSGQLLQVVACDRLHSLDCRCCRSLLLMQDWTGMDELPLTQESLAGLLGGGRPRVNKVLGTLERKGLVRRKRGRIKLLRRAGLEDRTCECYRIIGRMFEKIGITPRPLRNVA